MSYELTWGLLIIGIGVSAALYGIATAQVFYYYRTNDRGRDPLYTLILTGCIWLLITIHLALVIHIPWYYLIDGTGGKNDSKIAWSMPASIIVNNLIAFPVFAFYARRIRLLGGQPWLSLPVLCIGLVHFTCGMLFAARLFASGQIAILTSPTTLSIAYTAFAAGTMTDVGIAIIMCWLLARARTGHVNTDGVISAIMIYTVNSGMITAIFVVSGLISNLVAPTTQFELFFVSIIPQLYANAYLGSLNNRGAIQAQLSRRSHGSSGNSHPLGELRSPPMSPSTIVHIKRQTEARKDSISFKLEHEEGRASV